MKYVLNSILMSSLLILVPAGDTLARGADVVEGEAPHLKSAGEAVVRRNSAAAPFILPR